MEFLIFGWCQQGPRPVSVDDGTENPYGTAREPQAPSVLNRCATRAVKTIGNAHVRAIAGAVVTYGLATWWLAGSGLLIAGIGITVWLVSTLVKAVDDTTNAAELVDNNESPDVDPANVMFISLSASIGWATPAGWILLGAWDAYWLTNHLRDRCCPNVQRPRTIITNMGEADGYVQGVDGDGQSIKFIRHSNLSDTDPHGDA